MAKKVKVGPLEVDLAEVVKQGGVTVLHPSLGLTKARMRRSPWSGYYLEVRTP